MTNALASLRQFVIDHYDLEEVRTLSFDLGVRYDDLGEERITTKVRQLLLLLGRQRRLDELLDLLHASRPAAFDRAGFGSGQLRLEDLYAALPAFEQQSTPASHQRSRDQLVLIDKVKRFWIRGVLEQSLHGAAIVELRKESRPETLAYPWDIQRQGPARERRLLPPDQAIHDIFDATGYQQARSLLILGAPGSGKTTLLLDLARELLARAEQDAAQPIPVIFNLSTWSSDSRSLAGWLIGELNEKYLIPKPTAADWVANGQLIPLLDGLDEAAVAAQSDCVTAINTFRKQYLVDMVVCSRADEYAAIGEKLNVDTAVHLQPLTDAQIETYLRAGGLQLTAIRELLQRDEAFHELARSPLMLSIITMAYRGVAVEDLPSMQEVHEHRSHLLQTYVQQMYQRRVPDQKFSTESTTRGLAWLAERMLAHAQTIFLIERMQPSWLPTTGQTYLYGIIVILLVAAPIGLLVGLGTWLPVALSRAPSAPLIGIGSGLAAFLTVALAVRGRFGLVETLITALAFGLAFGLPLGQSFGVPAGAYGGVGIAAAAGLAFYLLGRRLTRTGFVPWNQIEAAELLSWSYAKALPGFLIGLITGSTFGYMLGSVIYRPVAVVFAGGLGIAAGLTAALLSGLTTGRVTQTTRPNEGIAQSARHALLLGPSVALAVGVPVGIAGGLAWTRFYPETSLFIGLALGISIGLAAGLLVGMFMGGLAVVKHYTLRAFLRYNSSAPRDYVRFLDHAVDCLFVHRVGGGYVFIHRLLQEYFAGLYQISGAATPINPSIKNTSPR